MEKIHVIGSNGIIGKALRKSEADAELIFWSHSKKNNINYFDIFDNNTWSQLFKLKPKNLILLSWPGLPNYNEKFHLLKNLPACIYFIDKLIENGLEKILVTGTCYEYGLRNGCIKEGVETRPLNYYALAKDTLRKFLELKCKGKYINYYWLRIFYPHGKGERESSLISSLEKAIKDEKKEFLISSGQLQRDFIPISKVSEYIMEFMLKNKKSGIYNCGSGKPTSIIEMIENTKKKYQSSIKIVEGGIPIREDEPFSFWADMKKYYES